MIITRKFRKIFEENNGEIEGKSIESWFGA
jgi:hypothetical protein